MARPDDIKQLAPTGRLRCGVVVAPAPSIFFAIRDDKGAARGVAVDLLRGFAAALKLPLDLQVFSNSGQVTDAVASGNCDVAFMPQDAARAERVDFGPAYFVIESTYLVPAGSTMQTIDDVNKPGVRIVAIANTTTMRSARRTAPLASVEEVAGVDLMTEMARKGDGDAFALSHGLICWPLARFAGRARSAGQFPADRHRCRRAQGPSRSTEARERAARRRQEIRRGPPRARCGGFHGCRGGAVTSVSYLPLKGGGRPTSHSDDGRVGV